MSNRDARLLQQDPYQRVPPRQVQTEGGILMYCWNKFRSLFFSTPKIKSVHKPHPNTLEAPISRSQHFGLMNAPRISVGIPLPLESLLGSREYPKISEPPGKESKEVQTDNIISPHPQILARSVPVNREPNDPSKYFETVMTNINREKKEYERRERVQKRKNEKGLPALNKAIITKIEKIDNDMTILNKTFSKINEEKVNTQEKSKETLNKPKQSGNEALTATIIKANTENKITLNNQGHLDILPSSIKIAAKIILPPPKIEQAKAIIEPANQDKSPKGEIKTENLLEKPPLVFSLSPFSPLSTPPSFKIENNGSEIKKSIPKGNEQEPPKIQIVVAPDAQSKELISKDIAVLNKSPPIEINLPVSRAEKIEKVEEVKKEVKASIPKINESNNTIIQNAPAQEADSRMQLSDEKVKPDIISPFQQQTASINPFATANSQPIPNGIDLFKKAEVLNTNPFNVAQFEGFVPFQTNAQELTQPSRVEEQMVIEQPRTSFTRDPSPYSGPVFPQMNQISSQSGFMLPTNYSTNLNQNPNSNSNLNSNFNQNQSLPQNIFTNSNPFANNPIQFNSNPVNTMEQSGNIIPQFLVAPTSNKDDDIFCMERRRK